MEPMSSTSTPVPKGIHEQLEAVSPSQQAAAPNMQTGKLGGGILIFAGPASGKTTLFFKHISTVYDPEMLIDFRTQPSLGDSFMWEHTIDLLSLYFSVAVPVILLALKSNRVAVSSCVGPQNAPLVRWFAEGISLSHDVAVLRLDESVLEARVAHRKQDPDRRIEYVHGGFTHTCSTHMLLHSFTTSCQAIRLIDSAEFVNAPLRVRPTPLHELPQDRLQSFAWEQKSEYSTGLAKHVAVAVLPHLFVLGLEDKAHQVLAVDLFNSTKTEIVLECVRKTSACARNHGAPCRRRMHVSSDQLQIRQHPEDLTPVVMQLTQRFQPDFLPTHKLRLPPRSTSLKCCVLAYYGTFAPMHLGHLETLQLAKEHAESVMSYHVLGAYVSPLPMVSARKAGMLDALLPWRERAAIVDFLLQGVDYAMVDPFCYETTGSYDTHMMHTLGERLERATGIKNVEVMWVNGTDVVMYSIDAVKLRERRCHLLLVPRQGCAPSRLQVDGEHVVETARQQSLAYSSTEVRKQVQAGNFTKAGDMMGNRAALAYLLYLKHESERALLQKLTEEEAKIRASAAATEQSETCTVS